MTEQTDEPSSLQLFSHATRKEWGVGILIRENDGKRAYVFEDGHERTMANSFHQLIRRVEQPNATQRAFYERQRGLLTGRAKANASTSQSDGPSFHDQVEKFHKTYSAGLVDPKWVTEIRGEGTDPRFRRHRDPLIREAQELLSLPALDALAKTQSFAQIWELVTTVLSHSDLVPATQLKVPKSAKSEHLRDLALATRELLHGKGPYEQRFDAYLSGLTLVTGVAPRWEIATAVSAAFHPTEHVCVHPTAFRQQLKVMGSHRASSSRPTSAGYARHLTTARLVATKLTEYGPPPRDLLDVYDFVRFTLGPATSA